MDGERVLIVNDDSSTVMFARYSIEDAGHTLIEPPLMSLNELKEYLVKLPERNALKPTVVVLDQYMPVEGGGPLQPLGDRASRFIRDALDEGIWIIAMAQGDRSFGDVPFDPMNVNYIGDFITKLPSRNSFR